MQQLLSCVFRHSADFQLFLSFSVFVAVAVAVAVARDLKLMQKNFSLQQQQQQQLTRSAWPSQTRREQCGGSD